MEITEKVKTEKNIKYYIESFFENARCSEEVFKVKEIIMNKVNEEYELEKEKDDKNAFEVIIQKYNSLETMVKNVGYDVSTIDLWFNKEVTSPYDEFKNKFLKKKLYIYIITLLNILSLVNLINSILFIKAFISFFIFSLFFLIVEIIIIINYNDHPSKESLPEDLLQELENNFDKYSKKCMIWLFILFIKIYHIVLNVISLSLNPETFELIEELKKTLPVLYLILFFFMKNVLIMKWLNQKFEFEKEPIFKKTMNQISILSVIYLIFTLAFNYEFDKIFVFNLSYDIIIIYSICAALFYYIGTSKLVYNNSNRMINKYILIPIAIVLIFVGGYLYLSRDIWLIQPLINSISYVYEGNNKITYNEDTGIYTIVTDSPNFKILQLTDIHLGGGVISYDKDVKAIEASYKLIEHTKPDLVVVTGDLTYPVGLSSFSFNNKTPVSQFSAFMRNTGVPWVFTYGNHDTENMAIGNKDEIDQLYKSLSWKTSKNLLYPYVQPEVNGEKIQGRNNQLVEIRNHDGTLNQALFLIDSNDYLGKGFSKYDYIHDDQVEWYKNEVLRLNQMEGKTISSLVFFHIPVQQYKIAYDLFINGSDEVKYFFGSNDEKRKNKVCTSKYPSKLFDTAKELNSTKGFFCGHDHYNNISLEYKGIRLTYGMSIDYLVEPGIARDTKQRGGTLITSHKDGTVDIEQIPLTSINKKEEEKK